jgi:RNA polymerase sigma-70 factor (ECF subfamily)
MDEREWLAERFDEYRPHLKAVAYRMLGSLAEADDAVQDAWLRLSRQGTDGVENLGGWLTTIVARVCLNMLRSRNLRHEVPLGGYVPDPLISLEDGGDPEHQAMLADSVGLALQVVLETLTPSERLAFVLHDMFDVPFGEIAPMVESSVEGARQLASRARRRVRGLASVPDVEVAAQRQVVNAFFAAARAGDLDGLVAVLHPDAVMRADGGPSRPGATRVIRGARAIVRASQLGAGAHATAMLRPALVNGAAGVILLENGQPFAVWGFTVAGGRIVEIDAVTEPERLRRLGLSCVPAPDCSSDE